MPTNVVVDDEPNHPHLSSAIRQHLLKKVADQEFDGDELLMLEEITSDSVSYGICADPICEAIADSCEQDKQGGFCEECEQDTLYGILSLAGLV